MPDTRHLADGKPYAKSDNESYFDADDEPVTESDSNKYFAILALDGDEFGKWVSGLHPNMPTLGEQISDYIDPDTGIRAGAKVYFEQQGGLAFLLNRKRPLSPAFHLQLSEMLANFSNFCVRRIVESFDGRLIYSGGDDVLAMLPATTVLSCAKALRAAFRGDSDLLKEIVGAWHVGSSGVEKDFSVSLFQEVQPGFIQLDNKLRQKGFALEGEPIKFAAMVPGPAADASVGIAIAHVKAPLQDVVREAQAAEKRAKKDLGRSAVAVTLFKRSGEIIKWGCKWEEGGLGLYQAIADAMVSDRLSSKFPYRIVELLDPYLTQQTPLMSDQKQDPDSSFGQVVDEIIVREFAIACDRQRGSAWQKEVADSLTNLLKEYLAKMNNSEQKSNPEQKLRAIIGFCQTVAFAHRTRREDTQQTTSNATL